MHEFEVRDYRVDWNIELSNREVFSVLPRDSIPTSNRKKVNTSSILTSGHIIF